MLGAVLLSTLIINNSIAEDKRPNIIIIMADDLDSKQLSCYGGKNIHTKNIDALAEQGMKFNQMVASEAMCIPTRASLFTGLYPARHGAHQNHKKVNNNLKSIGHYLGDAGYRVALTGKDHVTHPKSVFPFEIIDGFEPNCVSATDDYHLDSVRSFTTKKDKPYCLFIMSTNPHVPWTMGDPSEFDADKLELPAHWVDTKLTRNTFTKFLAEVKRLDNQVGDVMNMLKETGQEENTIVIFLGEQGPQFPGGKWTLWNNGQKSSMIVKWPGTVKPKTQTDAIVQYEDITPTLVDIAKGKLPEGLDGKSFINVLKLKSSAHREYAFGIHNNIPEGPAYPIRSIMDGKYKLILNLLSDQDYHIKWMTNLQQKNVFTSWVDKGKTDPQAKFLANRIIKRPAIEFYDLQKDPDELVNLNKKAKYQTVIKKMSKELDNWMQQQGDTGIGMDVPANN